jgi:inner membrane transporter RhtA
VAATRSQARGAGPLARAPSPLLVLASIGSVQFGSAIADTLFKRIGPGGAALERIGTAAILLVVLSRPDPRKFTRSQLAVAVTFGVVLAVMNVTFYHAIQRIPLGVAVTFEFVGPLTVAVAGSRRGLDFVWVALAAAGILALARGSAHGLDLLGVILALIAGATWGVYIFVNAWLGREFADGSGLAFAMVVATLVSLPDGLIEGHRHLLQGHSLLLGAAVGLLSSAIPYSFENEALRRIATNVFGVLMSLEPAFAALAGLLILGQGLTAREVVGMALVVLASAGASRGARPPVD